MTPMASLQAAQDLMNAAEAKITTCFTRCAPGEAASNLLSAYQILRTPVEWDAFVAILALYVAISRCRLRADVALYGTIPILRR